MAKPKTEPRARAMQAKQGTMNGKSTWANYDPDLGKYFDSEGKDISRQFVPKEAAPTFEEQAATDWLQKHPGKTVSDFYAYAKTLGPTVMAQLAAPGKADTRLDRSYDARSKELETIGKPVADTLAKIGDMRTLLDQNTPQADALVGPKLLTVMVGGQGSGLRMNEAEIARVVGGRSKWESLKAAINQWNLDPAKATSITPEQRKQIRDLVVAADAKANLKSKTLDDARQALIDAEDPTAHRKVVADVRSRLASIDEGQRSLRQDLGPTKGDIENGYVFQGGDPRDPKNWRKQ
jgi:hypothetical protein